MRSRHSRHTGSKPSYENLIKSSRLIRFSYMKYLAGCKYGKCLSYDRPFHVSSRAIPVSPCSFRIIFRRAAQPRAASPCPFRPRGRILLRPQVWKMTALLGGHFRSRAVVLRDRQTAAQWAAGPGSPVQSRESLSFPGGLYVGKLP